MTLTPKAAKALKLNGRRKYVETGGVRGPKGYEPTRRQYEALLRGEITGAELMATEKDRVRLPL